MDVLESIKTRRSIRKYKSDQIPAADLDIILEAIRWAPSWANTQCCEVVVVSDPGKRRKLSEACSPKNPGTQALLDAPVVLVMLGKKGVSGHYKGTPVTIHGDWLLFDVGLAMQNLALAAHSRGLGTVDMGYFDHEKVRTTLEIPGEMSVVAMTPLGYPVDVPKAPSRRDLTEIVSYDTFGRRSR
jgi:nitroreductase